MVRDLRFSELLRWLSTLSWSVGLALIPFDRVYLFSLASENARVSYLFFSVAALLCWWAEKREFGTRVTLYRLHDLAFSSPWRYLLLFFLWVNLFAPFTENPARSVVYALGGWFSLVSVAFSAQLIFCDRGQRGIALIPARLRIAFLGFNLSVWFFAGALVLHRLFPDHISGMLSQSSIDPLLFCLMGLPFLVWDFVNPKRHLLSRWLVGPAIALCYAAVFLVHDWGLMGIALLTPAGILAIGVYKQIRLTSALISIAAISLITINGVFLLSKFVSAPPAAMAVIQNELEERQALVESKLKTKIPQVRSLLEDLVASRFLGGGIGSSDINRGVWSQILVEVGVVGLALYLAFFLSLALQLWRIRSGTQVIVPNVALVSLLIFAIAGGHYARNPYSTGVWVWYALWTAFASTRLKRDTRVVQFAELRGRKAV